MNNAILELEQQLQQETDSKKRINLMNRLSWELRRLNSEQSLELAQEANKLALTIGYEIGSAESCLGMTIHDAYADNHSEALEKYYKVHQIFEKTIIPMAK